MSGTVGSANIKLGVNLSDLLAGFKAASVAAGKFTRDINTNLLGAFKQADAEAKVFRGGLTRLGNDLTGLAKKMSLFGTLPALYAAGQSYKDFASLEKLQKGLSRYGETLAEVRELAKLPNVGVFDGAKTLIGLRAVGIESDKATRFIKAFANAIAEAGGSSEDLAPALENIKQAVSGGKFNEVDIKQLSQRVPQIRKALKDAFGTVSAEELNKIGVDNVLPKLLTELEKIPPVAGGATASMDQLSDSFTFFSASIGEGLDKSLGITKAISNLGDLLDNLSTNFKNLSPEAQKSIVALGSIAVVLPLVIGAVGGLIKLLPILATGFGLVSGPVLAVIGVVAVAAAAIIANWEKVKEFLVESSWWFTLVGIVKSTLGVVVEVFKVVINFIQGDWENLGKALVNIFKNAWNLIIETAGGAVKALRTIFGGFLQLIGFKDAFDMTNMGESGIDKLVNKFKFDVPDALAATKAGIDSVKKAFNGLGGGGGAAPGPDKGAGFDPISIDKNAYTDLLKKEKEQLDEILRVRKEIAAITLDPITTLGTSKGIALNAFSTDPSNTAFQQSLAGQKASGTFSSLGKGIKPMVSELAEINKDISRAMSLLPQRVGESVDDYTKRIKRFVAATYEAGSQMTSAIRSFGTDISVGFGEALGNLASGVGGIESFTTRVLVSIGSLMKDLGKSMIGLALAGEAIKKFVAKPALALVAGIALVALGQVVTNTAQKKVNNYSPRFAKGGFAYSEMNAIVGDNPNSRFDPEMIAPYSKVDKSIRKSIESAGVGGGGNFEQVGVQVRGEDLYVILQRTQKRNTSLSR